MHVPDGFLDAPTSIATGVVAVGGSRAGAARSAPGTRRPYRPDGRPRRDLRVRRPDDELPGRGRHQRPPARRRAGRGARRALDRRAVHQRGAARPGALHGRRRHHRARHQHHPDGAGRRRGRLAGLQGVRAVLPKRLGVVAPAAAVGRARQRAGRRAGVHAAVRGRRHRAGRDRTRCSPRWSAWHLVIGIGEAVITGLVVGLRGRRTPRPRVRRPAGAARPQPRDPRASRPTDRHERAREQAPAGSSPSSSSSRCSSPASASYYASSHPDGLEYVAGKTGFLDQADDSPTADSPLADYSTKGVDDDRLSGGIAGVAGCAARAGARRWPVLGAPPRGIRGDHARDTA